MFIRMKTIGKQNWSYLISTITFLMICVVAEKQKRQIFREQVLPALGGKIPEEAFRTDRLALNRLNKEGITVPDGIILDARNVHKHTQHIQTIPEIIKVYITPDGRYIPPEGKFHYNHAKTIDTTYVIRTPYSRYNNRENSNFINFNKHRDFPKSQTYTNFKQLIPIIQPSEAEIYKPIITPLVLSNNAGLLEESYIPTWNIHYNWNSIYQPFDDYIINNIALFNSHQIITDYQGFLNKFHEQSSRHIESHSIRRNQNFSPRFWKSNVKNIELNTKTISYQNIKMNNDTIFRYPNLTKIPETDFTCDGKKGMFADVETNCQVFHNCSGWSKTSSLCPSGTAFSNAKKRCEWWNTVQ
ncbi:uncharacterized protein LOC107995733 isoform X2 [Apis cerana]|nr:uncharacterized protein LOC107995733 isoform X2 [Apis cerana]